MAERPIIMVSLHTCESERDTGIHTSILAQAAEACRMTSSEASEADTKPIKAEP